MQIELGDVGEAGDQADGYIIGTAASGALGFASVQITGGPQLWRFSPGDDAPTIVSEQYLLDLEREAFLKLCGERKTLERIQYTLKTGKTLRN